jgi:hypothetical protein
MKIDHRQLMNQGFLLAKLKSSLRKLSSRHHDLVNGYEYLVTNDHGYIPFVVVIMRCCPYS